MPFLVFALGLGALLTLEEAGVFLLPGDISLVAAGLHASPDRWHLLYTWLAGSAGMVIGASILFHGVARTRRFNRILPPRVRRLVRRHRMWGVMAARLVPGLRNATVFAAASVRLTYVQFLWALVPAAMIWSGLLLLLGWFGGSAMLATIGALHDFAPLRFVSAALLIGMAVFVWVRLRAGMARATR